MSKISEIKKVYIELDKEPEYNRSKKDSAIGALYILGSIFQIILSLYILESDFYILEELSENIKSVISIIAITTGVLNLSYGIFHIIRTTRLTKKSKEQIIKLIEEHGFKTNELKEISKDNISYKYYISTNGMTIELEEEIKKEHSET